jgi:hypothetical protein
MCEELPGAGFGQPHQVLDFEIVVELGFLLSRQRAGLLPFDEIPNPPPGRVGRFEIHYLPRTERGDELNQFLVWFHIGKFTGKRLVGEPYLAGSVSQVPKEGWPALSLWRT